LEQILYFICRSKSQKMKTRILIVFSVLFITKIVNAQLRTITNDAFQRGEVLKYRAYYDAFLTGEVNAGIASFEVKDEVKTISEHPVYHITVDAKTKGAFNWFYKVSDRYETYLDESTLAPWLFIRRIDEGGYIINQDVTFNQNKNVAYFVDNKKSTKSTISTPAYIQDILSAIYYCRSYDVSQMDANDEFRVKFMLDDSIYSTRVVYLGRETIKTSMGKVRCLKLKPQVLTGNVFKDQYPVTLWVSDDKNKVPVMAESAIIVGKVKLELIYYKGLKNQFASLVK
jgi:hypothetical protein